MPHSVARRALRLVTGRASVVLTAGALLAGCSGSSFFGKRFDNFTAHYNKFYNAHRTFSEQERKLHQGDPKIDTDHYVDIFVLPKQQGRSAEFEKVITKCADLLRNHPRSKWVDDALMLIGKSYFYQSNFVGAEQKFNEIINLAGPLKDEAQFWLARTLVASQSISGAEDVIGGALADEDLDKEWRSLFLLLRGDLRTAVGDWQNAIADIESGIEHVKDSDVAARGYFLLGQLYETEGQFTEAVEAYHKVQGKKPLYELSYAAMMGEVRVLGLDLDAAAALRKLESMMRDNKHFQNRDQLICLHARIVAAAGDPLSARDSFFDQLYPSDPSRKTSLRGEAHYRLAELYRDYLGDFYEAGVHFDTASSVLRTLSGQHEEFTPDAIVDAKTTAATFKDYRETQDQLARMDSLLYLGSLNKAAFDSAVSAVRIQLAERAARIQAELERRKTQSRFRQAAAESGTPTQTAARPVDQAAAPGAFGFLNYKNLQRVQEAFLNFKEVWGDRPLVPGWRREEAVALAQRQALEGARDGSEQAEETQIEQVRFLPPVDISEVPRDSASQAKMRSERAEARYRLANVLFLSIGLPDSAAKWYRKVIDEDAGEPVAQRALYAMAEVHDALGDAASARRTLERVIAQYPESEYANRARVKLGLEASVATAAADSLELATARYDEAYALWSSGRFDRAIDAMARTAADYPDLDVAAKALLAIGRIYLEKAHIDGSDFYGEIPLGDSVFTPEEIEAAVAAAKPAEKAAAPVDTTSRAQNPTADTQADSSRAAVGLDAEPATATPPAKPVVAADADSAAQKTQRPAQAEGAAPADSTFLGKELRVAEGRQDGLEAKPKGPPRREEGLVARNPIVPRNEGVAVVGPDSVRRRVGDRDLDRVALPKRDQAVRQPSPVDTAIAGGDNAVRPIRDVPVKAAADSSVAGGGNPARPIMDVVAKAVADTVKPGIDSVAAKTRGKPAEVKSRPAKQPEVTWIEPAYYVNDLIPIPMTLHALYGVVATRFGKTPYGKLAVTLRQGVEAARLAIAAAEIRAESQGGGEPADVPEEGAAVGKESIHDEGSKPDVEIDAVAPDSLPPAKPQSKAISRSPGEP